VRPAGQGACPGEPRRRQRPRDLLSVITQLLSFIGYPRTLNALRVVDEVVPAGG